MQRHLVQLVHFLEPCSLGLGALPGRPAHDGARGRDGPDQIVIVVAARACRAAGLKLGDGAELGAFSIAEGFGLGEVLIVFAFEALVGTSPHRAVRIFFPAGASWVVHVASTRKLCAGAAPHLGGRGQRGTVSTQARARSDGCARRTSCSSIRSLSPAASDGQAPASPHTTGAVGHTLTPVTLPQPGGGSGEGGKGEGDGGWGGGESGEGDR